MALLASKSQKCSSTKRNIIFSCFIIFMLTAFGRVSWFTLALKAIPTSDDVAAVGNYQKTKHISCDSPTSHTHPQDCEYSNHRQEQQNSPNESNNPFQPHQQGVVSMSHVKKYIKILIYIFLFPVILMVISAIFVYGLAHLPAFWVKPSYTPSPLSPTSSRAKNNIISSSNNSSSGIPSYEQKLIQKGGPLHHFTYIGTHNSCHVANIFGSLFIPHWRYTHLNLVEQLNCGIRHIELDCWFNVTTEEWELWHETIDPLVTPSIPLLRHVLRHDLHHWSIHHPGHFPLSINLDFKGAYQSKHKYVSFMVAEKNHSVIRHAFACLEKLILEIYKKDDLFTSEDMRSMRLSSPLSSTTEEVKITLGVFDDEGDNDDSPNSNLFYRTINDGSDDGKISKKLLQPSLLSRTSSAQSLRAVTRQYGWPDVQKLQNKTMFMLNLYGYKKNFRFDTAPQSVMFIRGQICDGDYNDALYQHCDNASKFSRHDVSRNDACSTSNRMNENVSENFELSLKSTTASDHVYLEDNAGYEKTKDYLNQNPNSLLRVTLLGSGSKRGPKDLSDAKIKFDELLEDGIHLVASNHPFHLATNMIHRNGLWNGDDD